MQMRKIADGLKKQRASDESAGDEAAVQSSRDIQMRLAQELRKGPFVMDSLIASILELGILQESIPRKPAPGLRKSTCSARP